MFAGKIDADLGGGVLKQRVAREGQGKSGGYRTIIFFRRGERLIFAFGFAKNERETLSRNELEAFRALADEFLRYNDEDVARLLATGEWQELTSDG